MDGEAHMTIAWREGLNTGNRRIDDDHRKLIGLINEIELILTENRGNEALTKALNGLYDYTNSHFEREEKIMRALGYEESETHAAAHQGLKRQLVGLRERLIAEAAAGPRIGDAQIAALTELLRNWLVNHIIGMDLKMKPRLAKAGHAFTGDD